MNLPDPLIAAEVDLTDFPFMPLDVRRLRDSDLASLESPEACWAAVLLWAASWHQVPAGSLPDDDRVLSQLAGFGRVVKEWLRVRDGALRSFVKCSDGRLYHPVVVEKAVEAWNGKLRVRWKRDCERIKKYHQRHKTEATYPLFEEWKAYRAETGSEQWPIVPPMSQGTSPDSPEGQPPKVPRDNTSMSPPCPPKKPVDSGQGEGEGQCKPLTLQPASTTPTGVAPPDPPQARASPTPAAALSKALRSEGVDSQPADPRLIAMAEQGVSAETLQAAAAEAKRAKPGERIPVGYVIGIVERWAKDAAAVATSGALKPGPRISGRQAAISNYAAQAAAARGESNDQAAASSERDITGESVRIA